MSTLLMELLDLTELLLDTRSHDLARTGFLESLWCGAWRRVRARWYWWLVRIDLVRKTKVLRSVRVALIVWTCSLVHFYHYLAQQRIFHSAFVMYINGRNTICLH